jgi:rhodanese-related sulfurtransferase
MPSLFSVSPERVEILAARRIDVRTPGEFAAAAIPNSTCVPLDRVERELSPVNRDEPILLICQSGRRAALAAEKLARAGFTQLAVLEGGVEGWAKAGFEVVRASGGVWSMERQVRAVVGALVLVFSGLAAAVSPWFLAGTAFFGAGLLFAGLTDTCTLGLLLSKMPWNRRLH